MTPRLARSSWRLGLPFLAGLLLAACSGERDPSEVLGPSRAGEIVVDAVLLVGEPLPSVVVTRTTEVERPWDAEAGVVGAGVSLLTPEGPVVYSMIPPVSRGVYVPNTEHIVQPDSEYRLYVVASGKTVTATTVTPAAFSIERTVLLEEAGGRIVRELAGFGGGADPYEANRLVHGEGRVEVKVPDEGQRYQVALFSLDPDSDFAVDVSFLPDDVLEDLERNSASPALSPEEGGLRLPWAAVLYQGRYLLRVFSIDDNWYDLVRSAPEFGGGGGFGGNTGDAFARPLFRVSGGIGLFGSGAVDSVGITVLAPPARISG